MGHVGLLWTGMSIYDDLSRLQNVNGGRTPAHLPFTFVRFGGHAGKSPGHAGKTIFVWSIFNHSYVH